MTSAEAPLLLLQLLDVPVQAEQIAQLSPQARRSRTFALLRQVFLHASQQPLVLAVENAQWVDAASEEWLTTLVERLPTAAIFAGDLSTRVPAALSHLEQAVALYDPQQHTDPPATGSLRNYGVGSRAYAADVLRLLGYPDRAQRQSHEALTQALAHPFTR